MTCIGKNMLSFVSKLGSEKVLTGQNRGQYFNYFVFSLHEKANMVALILKNSIGHIIYETNQ